MLKLLSLLIVVLFSFVSSANAQVYLKRLVDPETRSTLFLACRSQHECRVLAGGSFSDEEVARAVALLTLQHRAENAAIAVGPAVTISANVFLMFITLGANIPAGIIATAGTSAYVFFNHQDFESFKPIMILENSFLHNETSEQVVEAVEAKLKWVRKLNKLGDTRDRIFNNLN